MLPDGIYGWLTVSQRTLRCKRGSNESQPCTSFARTRLISSTHAQLYPRIFPLWKSVPRPRLLAKSILNGLVWLKENIVAPGIVYRFLPAGSEKDCFLRETIASCNNWNITHDEMEISLSLILLKTGLTGLGREERVSSSSYS